MRNSFSKDENTLTLRLIHINSAYNFILLYKIHCRGDYFIESSLNKLAKLR